MLKPKIFNKKVLKVVVVTTIVFLVIIIGLLGGVFYLTSRFLTDGDTKPFPTGKQLSVNYINNKIAFNELVQKIEADQKKGLERIDVTWTRPEDVTTIGMTSAEVEVYRETFKKLVIPRGFYAFNDRVELMAGASGLSISGRSIGYVYTNKEPVNYFKHSCGYSEKPLADIDSFKNCSISSYTIYQKIDDNWYLYDEYED
jgi:hypothetical protein